MLEELNEPLVIAISARALFDLETENQVFEAEGLEAYRAYQIAYEDELLKPGTAFHIIEGLLSLNKSNLSNSGNFVEVVILSSNSPDLSLRIFNSIDHYGLDIKRAAFSSGAPLNNYFDAFGVDLFLSRSEKDVTEAIDKGIASAVLYSPPEGFSPDDNQIRIAFDGDAVIFSEEAEEVYKTKGLDAFIEHERELANSPLPSGPFAKLLKTLSVLQKNDGIGHERLLLALVTARSNQTHERVIRTLRSWDISMDQAFFLGGLPKDKILQEFQPHIFFDDQEAHARPASKVAPSGKVPYKSDSTLNNKPTKQA